jgi:hypothetical protein
MSQLKNGAPLHYILQNCGYPCPNVKFRYTSTEEIDRKEYKIIENKKHMDTMKLQSQFLNAVLLLSVPLSHTFSINLLNWVLFCLD